MHPEAKRQVRHDRARARVGRQTIDHGVDRLAVDTIRVERPSLRLPHDWRASRGGVVQKPAPLPCLIHHAVVRVAQRNLEMGDVANEHLAEAHVPLVQFEGTVDVAIAVGQIGGEPLGREPALCPRPCRVAVIRLSVW